MCKNCVNLISRANNSCVLMTASLKYTRKHMSSISFSMFALMNMLNEVFLPKCANLNLKSNNKSLSEKLDCNVA